MGTPFFRQPLRTDGAGPDEISKPQLFVLPCICCKQICGVLNEASVYLESACVFIFNSADHQVCPITVRSQPCLPGSFPCSSPFCRMSVLSYLRLRRYLPKKVLMLPPIRRNYSNSR